MNIRRSVVRLAAAVACAVLVSPSAAGAKRRAGAIIYSIAEDEPGKPKAYILMGLDEQRSKWANFVGEWDKTKDGTDDWHVRTTIREVHEETKHQFDKEALEAMFYGYSKPKCFKDDQNIHYPLYVIRWFRVPATDLNAAKKRPGSEKVRFVWIKLDDLKKWIGDAKAAPVVLPVQLVGEGHREILAAAVGDFHQDVIDGIESEVRKRAGAGRKDE